MTRQPEIRALENPVWVRWFAWGALACAVILALWAIVLTVDRAQDIARFTVQGWPEPYAGVIVDNKIRSLWHAAFMTLCAGGALWFLVGQKSGVRSQESGVRSRESGVRSRESGVRSREPGVRSQESEVRSQRSEADRGAKAEHRTLNPRSFVAWFLVFLVAGDAWLLSRHYVKTMPMSALEENPVISLLKKDMPERRVALVTQEGFYNWWLTYAFPYHGIHTVNFTQMPRMPIDYKNFLSSVGRHPVRMWQLCAVGYVLAPAQVWQQIQHDPGWSNAFELVYSYNVAPADPERIEAGFNVYPATAQYPGQHVVLRLTRPALRYALIGKCRIVGDEEALHLLGSPTWKPFEEVLIGTGETTSGREPWGALTNSGIVGGCRLTQYGVGRVELDVDVKKQAILRIAEKYDRDWNAFVDGRATLVHRVDYLCQGIFVQAGKHHITLRYSPQALGLYVQLAGMAICLAAGAWLAIKSLMHKGPQ